MKKLGPNPTTKEIVGYIAMICAYILIGLVLFIFLFGFIASMNSSKSSKESDSPRQEQQAQEEQSAPASPDGELVFESETMRLYYRETVDLASMGLNGMLQSNFVVENLSDQNCSFGPEPGECVCDGYNTTMMGGALNVSPGNKAACPLQLNYKAQTGATSFSDIHSLSVKIRQTGDEMLNPLAEATADIQL